MAIGEKIPPRYFSYIAVAAAGIVCVVLLAKGMRKPAEYTVTMAVNHHSGYGTKVECFACHVPASALKTQIGCLTGACHGPYKPDTKAEDAIAELTASLSEQKQPAEARSQAEFLVRAHASVSGMACWSCHFEHQNKYPKYPAEWKKMRNETANVTPAHETYVSVAMLLREEIARK